MFKKICVFIMLPFSICAMEQPPIQVYEHQETTLHLDKVKALIGQKIPWELYHAKYSNEHRFQVGELIAIPNSHYWQTKSADGQPHYGQVKSVDNQGIIVEYGTLDLPREKIAQEAKQIGKFSSETLLKILAHKKRVTFNETKTTS